MTHHHHPPDAVSRHLPSGERSWKRPGWRPRPRAVEQMERAPREQRDATVLSNDSTPGVVFSAHIQVLLLENYARVRRPSAHMLHILRSDVVSTKHNRVKCGSAITQ